MDANRPLLVAAGLCGALGVALAAWSSHSGAPNTTIAANFLLAHAPAFVGLSVLGRKSRPVAAAALVLLVGLALFAADLAVRDRTGAGLFAMAAPVGGAGMVLGWLGVAIAAIFARRG